MTFSVDDTRGASLARRAGRVARAIACAAVFCGAATADAQAPAAAVPGVAPQMVNVAGRSATTLNGRWRSIIDPYETGYYNYRRRPDANGWFRDRKPANAQELIEYDFDQSPLLNVPGDWNSQQAELLFYEGTVWYRTRFERALAPGRRLFVHFGGANYQARAWMDGNELGMHEGGFTPFGFEVTDALEAGTHSLVVKVDNQRHPEAVPTVNSDWWNYGGITREVTLVETPSTFVRDYTLQLDPADPRRVRGWVQLDGPDSARTAVTIRIPRAGLSQTVTPDASGRAVVSFDARRLARWSPDHPNLYDVEIATAAETIRDRIGFRTLAVRGTQILLNGEPIFLRGISMHEESPYEARRAYSTDDARTSLGWVKELGGNFVRLAHYPHNEAMLRAADEMGVIVWAEIPVYWTIQWENPATLASARQQLGEMVTRDRNRASVALWSVANETPRDANPAAGPRITFLRNLVAHVRGMDNTRLITAALEHRYVGRDTIVIDDPLGEVLDVIGNNEYLGWYDGSPEKADSITWRSAFNKPLVMSEFGGDALQGLHGPAANRWTEEYQARIYQRQAAMLRRIPMLAGTSPWILKDFRSPRRPLPGIQDYFNRKGLISDRGERKLAFYELQRFYLELRAAHPDPGAER
ncbi:glycoside hydrolase family 2 protein [Longimicrobium terrae]|uniref:Beta-glucuronidase n=1 Tax=Longimicrobium terrae TaxID=1639882 RepID=A0A841H3X3_9BACT|nr:glycoside hydrolase family 2 TIM barrel-domain containing protein [Longimicrobium terrae]MBB4638505.1 beta-glucuronidase [Longimicrobium terrae]MBB6072652.1 beta-glucuronidase [Longimicrobium terrae]NNC32472.1 beta-glucuronidase [Longimicrobium terrae]